MRYAIITCLLLLALQPAAQAQTQLELNFQAKDKAMAADQALNQRYQRVTKGLGVREKALLTKAELKWIAFRDAECNSEEDQYRGGSMAQMVYWNCYQRLTEARTRELTGFTAGADDPKADKLLNQVYQGWLKEHADAKARQLLQQAELAWIAFRDAEADYELARLGRGRSGVLARITTERMKDLKALLDEARSH